MPVVCIDGWWLQAESVLGHDGLWHATRRDGTCLCSMGRVTPLAYREESATVVECVWCIVQDMRRRA